MQIAAMVRVLALALLVLALPAPAGAVERIILFVSDVIVERSGDLRVTETIRVEAEGNVIRRGILRDFPTVYTRPDGTRVVVGFQVESITRAGQPENWAQESISNGVRLRIGHADRLLRRGQHEYVIRYRTTRQIGFFANYDELYWNATGNGWPFIIDRAEARITLPEKVPFGQTAFYTGPQGARGQDASVVEQQPGRIVFRTTRPLPAHNGLTVAASWPKGLIEPPSAGRQAGYWLEDNRALIVACLGLLLVLGYYAFAWLRVGRDPVSGTIIPLFGPPQGMSPPAARYVDRMSFDDRCFTAAIIGLGVSGHLRVVDTGSVPTLEKRDGGAALTPEEQAMQVQLFGGRRAVELDQANHLVLGRAKEALKQKLADDYLGKLFANNFVWSGIGLVLTIGLVLAVLFALGASPHQGDLLVTMIMASIFVLPLIMGGAALAFWGWQRTLGGRWRLIGGLIMVAIGVAVGLVMATATAPGIASVIMAGALFIAAATAGVGFLLAEGAEQVRPQDHG